MTLKELLALPPVLAIKVIYDCLDEGTIAAIKAKPAIKAPQQPRFDFALYSNGGNTYASECTLKQLDWYIERCNKSIAEGGQYVEQNKKQLEKLSEWRRWRGCNPTVIWCGKRGDDEGVVAAPPSDRPRVYPRTGGNGGQAPPAQNQDVDTDKFWG
jgi:hypothetical protein